jgi:nucleotide-binding universal stress UspA family protein
MVSCTFLTVGGSARAVDVRAFLTMDTPKKIIVGTDNSTRAGAAVEFAAELAEFFKATLHIVTVHRPVPAAHAVSQHAVLPLSSEQSDAEAVAAHLDQLEPVARTLHDRGLDVEVHVVTGDPVAHLVSSADRVGADLIVIGDKGLHGWRAWFGSVPRGVLRNAKTPVLVVPTAAGR